MEPMQNIPARGGLNFDKTPFLAIWESRNRATWPANTAVRQPSRSPTR